MGLLTSAQTTNAEWNAILNVAEEGLPFLVEQVRITNDPRSSFLFLAIREIIGADIPLPEGITLSVSGIASMRNEYSNWWQNAQEIDKIQFRFGTNAFADFPTNFLSVTVSNNVDLQAQRQTGAFWSVAWPFWQVDQSQNILSGETVTVSFDTVSTNSEDLKEVKTYIILTNTITSRFLVTEQ